MHSQTSSRSERLHALETKAFDLAVIGGGASGLGVALEASLQGWSVALVEADDFAGATSGASTKLAHGGVRYLERAFRQFAPGQFALVREALRERSRLRQNAPHLCRPLPIHLPLRSRGEHLYYGLGLKLYDLLAGKSGFRPARYDATPGQVLSWANTKGLRGAWVYEDGQFNDALYALALARSAQAAGAALLNHAVVNGFEQSKDGAVQRVLVTDNLPGGRSYRVQARCVVNCTGPASDAVRALVRPDAPPRLRPSRGIHLMLPKPPGTGAEGLLIPQTSDGRILFVLPWLESLMIGTTETPAGPEQPPRATPEEINFLLREAAPYLRNPPQAADIRAVFAGNRPLVAAKPGKASRALVRRHVVEVWKPERMLNLLGGKWTTYRQMAEDTVRKAGKLLGKPVAPSPSRAFPLIGAPESQVSAQAGAPADLDLLPDINAHLGQFGREADAVKSLIAPEDASRLHPDFPCQAAELRFFIRHGFAERPRDLLANRLRLEHQDWAAARAVLPRVLELLAEEKRWEPARVDAERRAYLEWLDAQEAPLNALRPAGAQTLATA